MPIVSFSFSKVRNFISNIELKCLKISFIIVYELKRNLKYLGRSDGFSLVILFTSFDVLLIQCMYKCSGIIGTVKV